MSAATVCAEPGCPAPALRAGRCRSHPLRPSTWPERQRRRRVLERARGRCERCRRRGTLIVDHRRALQLGGSDDDANLWALCTACHRAKTAAEAAVATERARR